VCPVNSLSDSDAYTPQVNGDEIVLPRAAPSDEQVEITYDLLAGLDVSRGEPNGIKYRGQATWVTMQSYLDMKRNFERSSFIHGMNGQYYSKLSNGAILQHKDAATASRLWALSKWGWGEGIYSIPFSQWWIADNTARMVTDIVYSDTILDDGEGPTFYTKAVLSHDLWDVEPYCPTDDAHAYQHCLSMFKELIEINSGGAYGSEPFLYVRNYLVWILKHPHTQQGVMLILSGEQGAGKDSLMKFFKLIIGKDWTGTCVGFKKLMSKHSTIAKEKLLIYIEEGDDVGKFDLSDINGLITSDSITIDEKHKSTETRQHSASIIVSINRPNPFVTQVEDVGERRYYLTAVSKRRIGDAHFWTEMYKLLADQRAMKTIAAWLLSVDVSNFSARTKVSGPGILPDPTQFHNQVFAAAKAPPIYEFVDNHWQWFQPQSATAVLGAYLDFLRSNEYDVPRELEGPIAAQMFGQNYLGLAMRRGTLLKTPANKYSKPFFGGGGGVRPPLPPPPPPKRAKLTPVLAPSLRAAAAAAAAQRAAQTTFAGAGFVRGGTGAGAGAGAGAPRDEDTGPPEPTDDSWEGLIQQAEDM